MTGNIWTDTMNRRFAALHRDKADYSFEEMAKIMSAEFGIELTRNATIGKARRLNLPMRDNVKMPRKQTKQGVRMLKVKATRVDAPIPPEPDPAPEGGLTIYQLRDGVCHWPGGAMLDYPPFLYCGEAAPFGTPYCATHRQKAYNSPKKHWE